MLCLPGEPVLTKFKAYIIYRIALCIHLEVYLALSMLILNETIRVDLVWLLKIRVISNL